MQKPAMTIVSADQPLEQPPTLDSFNGFLLHCLQHVVKLSVRGET
jgi:hypothetical protein